MIPNKGRVSNPCFILYCVGKTKESGVYKNKFRDYELNNVAIWELKIREKRGGARKNRIAKHGCQV